MPTKDLKPGHSNVIALCGDPAIDWFEEKFPATGVNPSEKPISNASLRMGWKWHGLPGGVLLLDRLLFHILEARGEPRPEIASVIAERDPHRNKSIDTIIEEQNRAHFVHSLALVSGFDDKGAGTSETVYRAEQYLGFAISSDDWSFERASLETPLRLPTFCNWPSSTKPPGILVIDDAGNGFRHLDATDQDDQRMLPPVLRNEWKHGPIDLLIIKINDPLPAKGERYPLWKRLRKKAYRNRFTRRVVVVGADDLRRHNVALSHRLSWDRTLEDLAAAVRDRNPYVTELLAFGELVVRFGVEGIVHFTDEGNGGLRFTAIYNPDAIEGDAEIDASRKYSSDRPSRMPGSTAAFMAGLTAECWYRMSAGSGEILLPEACKSALQTARAYLGSAFTVNGDKQLDFRYDQFSRRPETSRLRELTGTTNGKGVEPRFGGDPQDIEAMALEYLRSGETSLAGLPRLRYSKLLTADRTEIEAYRAIASLLDNHIHRPKRANPLCLAVFGAPGSGKSFGVKQIALTLGGEQVKPIEVNVAQFNHPSDLVGVLHLARDEILRGKIPLVFFDEFDTRFGEECAWLKWFLQPMQDGKFGDHGRTHVIDRAIFVFAGGTAGTFECFVAGKSDPREAEPDERRKTELRAQKRPDFISRLHGSLDVRGYDHVPDDPTDRRAFTRLRRAILLRSMLFDNAPGLFSSPDRASARLEIADSVARAFLDVQKYNHGARSIESIIRMCALRPGTHHFSPSLLPPPTQIAIHASEDFADLLKS